jgi:hypothetical protein
VQRFRIVQRELARLLDFAPLGFGFGQLEWKDGVTGCANSRHFLNIDICGRNFLTTIRTIHLHVTTPY